MSKHEHDEKTIHSIINRLSRAAGHLESVKTMLSEGEDCSAVLIQLAAVSAAINNAGKLLLKHHLSHCIVEAMENHDIAAIDELSDAIDKFVK